MNILKSIKIKDIRLKKVSPFIGACIGFASLILALLIWIISFHQQTTQLQLDKIPSFNVSISEELSNKNLEELVDDEHLLLKSKEIDEIHDATTDLGKFDDKMVLNPSPFVKLYEKNEKGIFPIISDSNVFPYQAYARPSSPLPHTPKISIILTGIGIDEQNSETMIKTFPGKVTLSFSPYSENLEEWTALARSYGHEFLLEIPLEPYRFPKEDAGPYTIMGKFEPMNNIERLNWLMTRTTGYIGFINLKRSRLTSIESSIGPILTEINKRGLLYVDNISTDQSTIPALIDRLNLPFIDIDVSLDQTASRESIKTALTELELKAYNHGHAIGIATTLPLTVEMLSKWFEDLEEKNIALVPASAYYINKDHDAKENTTNVQEETEHPSEESKHKHNNQEESKKSKSQSDSHNAPEHKD